MCQRRCGRVYIRLSVDPGVKKKNNIYNPHVNDTIMHGGRVIDLDNVKRGGY